MDIMKDLTDYFWMTIVVMLFIITIVSIVLGILLEMFKVVARGHQKAHELRIEELRLQVQLEKQKKENRAGPSANIPLPKESSWAEQSQTGYEMGYQQQG
jgi:hypothetical protein